ncbi:hypothetical protein [uncultured Draconibacterium sp.]|uniref:Ppx/GppA phosphatase family protein n=1 Tax=uncultured Draconibacterium sp. TaxID=1573823 RepID=UPI002AA687F6|nr:hypothetical protein [uncultured Draconibacterium sp.]
MYKTIIDIGTNSLKVFVFDISQQTPIEVKKVKIKNRLGDNILENSNISNIGIENTINIISELKDSLSCFKNNTYAIFGTEIFRRAGNISTFSQKFYDKTNVNINILSQEEEAEYFWKGIVGDFEWDGIIAAIDIGGGSVQFMYGTKEKLHKVHKLKTGALFLRNKFIPTDPPNISNYHEIEKHIQSQIANIDITFPQETPFIHGSTSVISFFKESKIRMSNYKNSKLHPYKIDLNDVDYLYKKMRTLPSSERQKYFPSQPEYTDGCSIGFANVLQIAKKTGLSYELPSNNSLIHGFI